MTIIIRKILIIIICCICVSYCYSQETSGGLLFTSSAEKVDKRTSLILFGDKLQKFEDSFTISFDLSIWDINQFGYVFRAINEQKQEVDFVFVNFYGTDKMYLDFHSPITHKSVQIPISEESIYKKEVLHFDLHFNLKEDKAEITFRDSVYTCTSIGLENPSLLQFAFGLYGLNLDVPQMLIKNINIQAENNKSYFFPLDESDGEYAHNKTSNIKARVKNPDWIINKHFYWQTKSELVFDNDVFVTYDELRNRILIISGDSLLYYYPRYEKTDGCRLNNIPDGFKIYETAFNSASNQYYILGTSGAESSKEVADGDDFAFVYLNLSEQGRTSRHNSFFSETGNLFYQFGGYGNHLYSNAILQYNEAEYKWDTIVFSGDEIMPRSYSSSGNGIETHEKLIFGGFGNKTGKEEHGGQNLYDLYVLNLNENKIRKLWDLKNYPENVFVPSNDLILNKEHTHFYTLCYPHHKPDTEMFLYRFNLNDGTYDIMSDSIRIISENANSYVNLFHSDLLGEFYAVVKEYSDNNKTKVMIYSLSSPPISKLQLNNSRQKLDLISFVYVFIIIAVLVIILIIWLLKKKRSNKVEELFEPDNFDKKDESRQKKSAIYIFGNFIGFDRNGNDISHRFAQKLRALFSIILLHTEGESGISTEKLNHDLWNDKDMNKSKSIRGVTINRLRNILSDIGGITLVHQNSQWFFVFEDTFYCDYLECCSNIKVLEQQQKESNIFDNPAIDKLVSIVSNGALFFNLNEAWIDTFKLNMEDKLEQLLRNYIVYLYENKQYIKLISTSNAFFIIEPIDEEIFDLCMKSYQKTGKKEQAKVFLNRYKDTYKLLMGEEYKE